MTYEFYKEIIDEFRLFWGLAPEGTLKYNKRIDIESFLKSQAIKSIEEEVERLKELISPLPPIKWKDEHENNLIKAVSNNIIKQEIAFKLEQKKLISEDK